MQSLVCILLLLLKLQLVNVILDIILEKGSLKLLICVHKLAFSQHTQTNILHNPLVFSYQKIVIRIGDTKIVICAVKMLICVHIN